MFKFLKDKLKSFFKKSEEAAEPALPEESKQPALPPAPEIQPEQKQPAVAPQEEHSEEKKAEEQLPKLAEPEKPAVQKESVQLPESKEIPAGQEQPAQPEIKEEKKKGFFSRIFQKLDTVKFSEENFAKVWGELETILIESNVALEVIDVLKENMKQQLVETAIPKKDIEQKMKDSLKEALAQLLLEPSDFIPAIRSSIAAKGKPYVIVFFGINGTGKTTTIAKVAHLLKQNNLGCVLAASDTFRAASIEQLQQHAAKLNVKVIRHDYGSDAAAVAYDAIQYAKSSMIDVVLIDTAGRMHTEANLMREMEKICKVTQPDLKIFIGESTVGNDMLEQAKAFSGQIGLDGMILTKVDVDEKGGTAISASYITKKPILFLGTGQEYNDLEPFSAEKLLTRLGL